MRRSCHQMMQCIAVYVNSFVNLLLLQGLRTSVSSPEFGIHGSQHLTSLIRPCKVILMILFTHCTSLFSLYLYFDGVRTVNSPKTYCFSIAGRPGVGCVPHRYLPREDGGLICEGEIIPASFQAHQNKSRNMALTFTKRRYRTLQISQVWKKVIGEMFGRAKIWWRARAICGWCDTHSVNVIDCEQPLDHAFHLILPTSAADRPWTPGL